MIKVGNPAPGFKFEGYLKDQFKDYNVLIEDEGVSLRGTFIIDPEGTIKHMTVSDNDVGRNVDETLRVLAALQTGQLCPVNWRPGEATLSS